jgi:hypothetical protein
MSERKIDWEAEAVEAADFVRDNMFEAHRGAAPWRQVGVAVIFGNDDYKDDRAKKEVEELREACYANYIKILGFGVDSTEGYCWAMLVELGQTGSIPLLDTLIAFIAMECGYGNDPITR